MRFFFILIQAIPAGPFDFILTLVWLPGHAQIGWVGTWQGCSKSNGKKIIEEFLSWLSCIAHSRIHQWCSSVIIFLSLPPQFPPWQPYYGIQWGLSCICIFPLYTLFFSQTAWLTICFGSATIWPDGGALQHRSLLMASWWMRSPSYMFTEWRDQKFHPRPIPRLFLN